LGSLEEVVKKIKLTQGKYALVDDEDYEWLTEHKWYYHCGYARRMATGGKRKIIHMHREILKTPKDFECDHIDRNRLNNQKINLRNVTRSQNTMNSGVRSDNTLGVKCISPHKNGFRVQIYKNGKHVYNKKFSVLDDAISARNIALKKYHGEYAAI